MMWKLIKLTEEILITFIIVYEIFNYKLVEYASIYKTLLFSKIFPVDICIQDRSLKNCRNNKMKINMYKYFNGVSHINLKLQKEKFRIEEK